MTTATRLIRQELASLKKRGFTAKKIAEMSGQKHTTVWRVMSGVATHIDLKFVEALEDCGIITPLKDMQDENKALQKNYDKAITWAAENM